MVRTMPFQYNSAHIVIVEMTLLYRSTSCLVMQDDGSSVALTMRFEIFDIYVSFHGRTFM